MLSSYLFALFCIGIALIEAYRVHVAWGWPGFWAWPMTLHASVGVGLSVALMADPFSNPITAWMGLWILGFFVTLGNLWWVTPGACDAQDNVVGWRFFHKVWTYHNGPLPAINPTFSPYLFLWGQSRRRPGADLGNGFEVESVIWITARPCFPPELLTTNRMAFQSRADAISEEVSELLLRLWMEGTTPGQASAILDEKLAEYQDVTVEWETRPHIRRGEAMFAII